VWGEASLGGILIIFSHLPVTGKVLAERQRQKVGEGRGRRPRRHIRRCWVCGAALAVSSSTSTASR